MKLSDLLPIFPAFFFVMRLLIGKRNGEKPHGVLQPTSGEPKTKKEPDEDTLDHIIEIQPTPSEPKTQCANCGAKILQRTADTYGGLCVPCYRKTTMVPSKDWLIRATNDFFNPVVLHFILMANPAWPEDFKKKAEEKAWWREKISMADPAWSEKLMKEAKDKAWWKEKAAVCDEKDEELAVIAPLPDTTAEERRLLGMHLRKWQEAHEYVRYIWGLEDLLQGQFPRTPPIFFNLPYLIDQILDPENCHEPVALVMIMKGTDYDAAMEALAQSIKEFQSNQVWFLSFDTYFNFQR